MKLYAAWKKLIRLILPSSIFNQVSPLLRSILKFVYIGKKHQCPCCESNLRKFADDREICPVCGSGKRHRLQWLVLDRKFTFFDSNADVLDIAPMQYFQNYCLQRSSLKYLSADLSSELAMDKIDLTATPYPDSSFDFILCSHVLEHIPDDRAAMKEMYRLLRPTGIALIQVPLHDQPTYEDASITDPLQRTIHFGQADHVRIYGSDITQRLRNVGFSVISKSCDDLFPRSELKYFGLDETETIFTAKKPKYDQINSG
ncbi:MAG: methyltransferase domain-containing protein [Candidatus Heimdallarchaeota archaeon]|nr:methyltransferase domain-containing protein [Candidatus Heimdallarchaeota archaeon]